MSAEAPSPANEPGQQCRELAADGTTGGDAELLVAHGGHLHRALRWAGLETSAPAAAAKVAIVLAVVTWLPLLVVSLAEARRVGAVPVPFLKDFSTEIRFLVALPLLALADSFLEPRLAAVARHFTVANVVPPADRARFFGAIVQARSLLDAALPQVVIMAVAVGLSLAGLTSAVAPEVSSWRAVLTPSGPQRSWAGVVYDFLSLPVYRLVMFTWMWRYAVWIWFLWRTSRLDLRLAPGHPDGSGGLGFIGVGQAASAILIFVSSVSTAGVVGMQAVYRGASLASFYPLLAGYLAWVLIVFLGPLIMFSPALFRAKERGLYEYSTLGEEYVTAFAQKWIGRQGAPQEPLLGTPDIQSLADLAGSFEVVRKMRLWPFNLMTVTILTTAAVAPLLPLALLEHPATELLGEVVRLLL